MPLSSAQKVLVLSAGVTQNYTPVTVGGAGNAYNVPALGNTGQLDLTMMPTGIGPQTQSLPALV